MKIAFKITEDDWIAFQKDYMSQSKVAQSTKLTLKAFVPAIFLILIYLDFIEGEINYIKIAIFTIVAIIYVVAYEKRYDSWILQYCKKALKEGDNSSFLGRHEVELANKYLLRKTSASESKTLWEKLPKYEENEKYLFIYTSAISACIIPKFKLNKKEAEKVSEFVKLKLKKPSE